MDLEDEGWVNIPYDGILEVHDDGGAKIFSRKHVTSLKKLIKMDYIDAPQKSQNFVTEESRLPKQLIPLPVQLDHGDEVREIIKLPILIQEEPRVTPPQSEPDQDQDPIFHVFFKKENKFVETKIDSSKLNSRRTNLSDTETDPFRYEEKSDDHMGNGNGVSPSKVIKEEVVVYGESDERLNVWKWGLSGIGAFCSLGMAAATICIIIFGNGKRHHQKLDIQIYSSDNKRIKQVVHHANEAMSTIRGVPLAKAHITYGGSYEPL